MVRSSKTKSLQAKSAQAGAFAAGPAEAAREARSRRAWRRGECVRVAVLMGGPSSEHEVSLVGGVAVATALARLLPYEVRAFRIAKNGVWSTLKAPRSLARPESRRRTGSADAAPLPFDARDDEAWREIGNLPRALETLADWPVDVVFPVLHGRFGEDGTIQACLAACGLACVGSDMRASSLAFDKVRTKEILLQHGLPTPPYRSVPAATLRMHLAAELRRFEELFGYPYILKDPLGGSSVEVRKVADDGEALVAAQDLLALGAERLMAEQFIAGRELTVAVLDGRDGPRSLPLVEIRPRGKAWFDYQQKYAADGAEEICPAPVDEAIRSECARLGEAVHALLGLSALSRTDIMLDAENRPWILETNTLPGMTPRSLVPLAAREAGIAFPALLEALVRAARPG